MWKGKGSASDKSLFLASISAFSGIILAGVARSRRDQKRLSFLSFKRVPQTAAQMTSLETLRGNI